MSVARATSFVVARFDPTSAAANLATVPAGQRWKVQDVVVFNESAVAHTVTLAMNRGAISVNFMRQSVGGVTVVRITLDLVLNAGDNLVRGQETGAPAFVDVAISGFALTLP